jgi:hypothetical protein
MQAYYSPFMIMCSYDFQLYPEQYNTKVNNNEPLHSMKSNKYAFGSAWTFFFCDRAEARCSLVEVKFSNTKAHVRYSSILLPLFQNKLNDVF